MSFEPISLNDIKDGLVWSDQGTPQYLAELQTGGVAQLVHLVIFDVDNNNEVVHEEVRAFKTGDTFGEEDMPELAVAVTEALEGLA